MSELAPILRPGRSNTLTRAEINWVSHFQGQARADFPYGSGPPLNTRCNLEQHVGALRTTGERPSTPPQPEEDATPKSPPEDGSADPHPTAQGSSGSTESSSNGGAPLPGDSTLNNRGNEQWSPQVPPATKWDFRGAEDFRDGPPSPPPPKEPWGPHCGHKYSMTNTEYVHTAWRYDVVTDVEIYRVSTIPDDFIGTSPWNNWTFEVLDAYHKYKEIDRMSDELENAAQVIPVSTADMRTNFHRSRYEAALRAANMRIDFLRRWPSAFEQHDGTFNHWERALQLLKRAESARLDGMRADLSWSNDPFDDLPDVPVQPHSGSEHLDVTHLSATAFGGIHVNSTRNYLQNRVRLAIQQPWDTKFRVADCMKGFGLMQNYIGEKDTNLRASDTPKDSTTTQELFGEIYNISRTPPYLPAIPIDQMVMRPDFTHTPFDLAGRFGKPVLALSPQQYEEMRTTNNGYKTELRALLNEPEDVATLEDNAWEYTIRRRPWAGYPDLPELKPELRNCYKHSVQHMQCSSSTLERLAGFWPRDCRLGSTMPRKC